MTTEAFINRDILRWALEREHLTTEAAAERVKVKPERLAAWENGAKRPTFVQAKNLAQKLNIPFGYFFLSARPSEALPLPDLRTVADEPPGTPSSDLTDLLNDVLRKQQWYHEYLEVEEADPIPFIGRYSLQDDPETIASDVRKTLGINDDLREAARGWEDFLRLVIRRAEERGVLVLRSGVVENNTHRKLNVEEFRGFSVSDDLAPLVFINGQDAKAAQIFTLAHELAHLWIGSSGVSNPDYRRTAAEQNNITERVCNGAAAETLLPARQFLEQWNDGAPVDTNVQSVAARYRVSSMVVLRRAYDLDKIRRSTFWDYYNRLQERWQRGKASGGGGGDFYATLFARNSSTLTQALMSAVAEGSVLHRDAAHLLNVSSGTLSGIAERLFGGASHG